jgi:hypothetical protein
MSVFFYYECENAHFVKLIAEAANTVLIDIFTNIALLSMFNLSHFSTLIVYNVYSWK